MKEYIDHTAVEIKSCKINEEVNCWRCQRVKSCRRPNSGDQLHPTAIVNTAPASEGSNRHKCVAITSQNELDDVLTNSAN